MPVDPHPFVLVCDPPEEFAGLTPELLANIHDIVSKVGRMIEGKQTRHLRIKEVPDVLVVLNTNNKEAPTLQLAKAEGGCGLIANLMLLTKGGILVLWDTRLPVTRVQEFIRVVDKQMRLAGLVDLTTGDRLARETIQHPPVLYRVDDNFRIRGATHYQQPGEESVLVLRMQFDHPEQLEVVQYGPEETDLMLCRHTDVPFILRRHALLVEVAELYGFKPGEIPEEPMRQAVAVEVDRRLVVEFDGEETNDRYQIPEG